MDALASMVPKRILRLQCAGLSLLGWRRSRTSTSESGSLLDVSSRKSGNCKVGRGEREYLYRCNELEMCVRHYDPDNASVRWEFLSRCEATLSSALGCSSKSGRSVHFLRR